MIRNMSLDIFCIAFMLGQFRFVPNYILVLIIFSTLFDAIALYFTFIDKPVYNRNPDFKKIIDIYLKYTKPESIKVDPVWFFLDRFGVGTIFAIFIIYYYYTNGVCK